MARNVKSVVAVKGCGCVAFAHAVTPGFGRDDEAQFRHRAEVGDCEVHVMSAGRSEREEFRCAFGGDRRKGCQLHRSEPRPAPDGF